MSNSLLGIKLHMLRLQLVIENAIEIVDAGDGYVDARLGTDKRTTRLYKGDSVELNVRIHDDKLENITPMIKRIPLKMLGR